MEKYNLAHLQYCFLNVFTLNACAIRWFKTCEESIFWKMSGKWLNSLSIYKSQKTKNYIRKKITLRMNHSLFVCIKNIYTSVCIPSIKKDHCIPCLQEVSTRWIKKLALTGVLTISDDRKVSPYRNFNYIRCSYQWNKPNSLEGKLGLLLCFPLLQA